MKAAFFTNPLSHTVSKRGSILDAAGGNSDVLRFKLDRFSNVGNQVEETANAQVNAIFVEGGDGTIHGVLTEVLSQQEKFDELPDIILLPGGMTNLVASNIGVKKPTPSKIDQLISSHQKMSIQQLINHQCK